VVVVVTTEHGQTAAYLYRFMGSTFVRIFQGFGIFAQTLTTTSASVTTHYKSFFPLILLANLFLVHFDNKRVEYSGYIATVSYSEMSLIKRECYWIKLYKRD
jgi:hypothetical protein